jgi:MerR family mercuric resistance operon transcriptional regulator
MPVRYTISQLGRAADVPTSTVRYYERVALLEPEDRSEGNYRLYTDESLRRLKFIRAAQSIGFSLDHVRTLLGTGDGRTLSCADVQSLIRERLGEIEQRLKDLLHVERVLKSALRKCVKTQRSGCCHVLETLRKKS